MIKERIYKAANAGLLLAAIVLLAVFRYILWETVPRADVRHTLLALCAVAFFLSGLWGLLQRRQITGFADSLCATLDDLIAGKQPETSAPLEDSLTARVQDKLLRCWDIMNESRLRSRQDKQTLQELISDISHQVKTPVANLRMFAGILREHHLTEEKRAEFLDTLAGQVDKLDFLMQSLIKMSRLETGTFALRRQKAILYDTIARAIDGVWAKAEAKGLQLTVTCDSHVTVTHDPRWTAEALENILDNAVKYTPAGGGVSVTVRPWQFYTRIDISDTGIGIQEKHYNDVFRRFYRAGESSSQEGVGLGLYLAQGIITRQKGYISLKSRIGEGTTFSVFLPS